MSIIYKGAYGKKVKIKEGLEKIFDNYDNEVDKSKVFLVTQYIDSEDEIVGIYPLEDGGFTESELLSVQSKKHEVFCDQLEYV
ncbi:hypothetical protein [Brevibacillus laterosporus]|uniref:hypothetical protein n=1 Tax=Brevibacillus laterosporus TaxID=1465 RepID=UPI002E218156|nr:hypothetical protein [Brevibacillus laterosporus]MED1667174.1 hypothetical protein [Brevibacillus laterosporus]MED1719758.1 hypothetical protein [Brevibacillus laterosporus]